MGADAQGQRERVLTATLVELADTLVKDYEVGDFLYLLCERAVQALNVVAAGVLVVDDQEQDGLYLAAASAERVSMVELFELQSEEGPCLEAYRGGEQVVAPDLEQARRRWPVFTPLALDAGLRAVYAFPLRLRAQRLGALNLSSDTPGDFSDRDMHAAQALADVTTIGILQARKIRESREHVDQLQRALESRVTIEQAKGVIATLHGVDMGEAFERLRRYARDNQLRLHVVAAQVAEGDLPAELQGLET